eukprot:GILJ01005509.1.p1 GENE.GILJ01005509.1~~GILJ01005509.1.p1  ORF type:complete len:733 (+),score=97.78 GILJ01005509.1:259-2199(+)
MAVITLSQNDDCRLDITSGITTYFIKCATISEKEAWMKALLQSRAVFSSVPAADVTASTPTYARQLSSPGESAEDKLRSMQSSHAALVATLERLTTATVGTSNARLVLAAQTQVSELMAAADSAIRLFRKQQTQFEKEQVDDQKRLRTMEMAVQKLAREHHTLERRISMNVGDGGSEFDAEEIFEEDGVGEEFFDALNGEEASRSARLTPRTTTASPVPDKDSRNRSRTNSGSAVVPHTSSVMPSRIGVQTRRTRLPRDTPPNYKVSIWGVIKDSIGKDLSKLAVPVYFNEPLSFLQRMTEDLEYCELLDKAAAAEDSTERMMYIGAFNVVPYAATLNRTMKPFNPLLGETYEYVCPEKGFKFLAEQVSHHPPVSAFIAESDNFVYYSGIHARSKFWGKSLEIHPEGTMHLLMPKHGEHYTWTKATTIVNNIIIGKMWIDHYGTSTITNHQTGEQCKMTLMKRGWFDGNAFEVQGQVFNRHGEVCWMLFGKWNEELRAMRVPANQPVPPFPSSKEPPPPQSFVVWRRTPLPANNVENYYFSSLAITLNELTPEMKLLLCPTDTRFRPDQRALEEGNVPLATVEKHRLEEKQRTVRKFREKNNISYEPRWFKEDIDPITNKESWIYCGNYWEQRESGEFTGCQDIYS